MENNKAIVARLSNIERIENADKIVKADVMLGEIKITQVVVGIDTKENMPVIYFDSNLCLDNKIILDYPELSTYLGKGNRIRTIRLKGIISNGLALPVDKFYIYFNNEKEAIKILIEGYSFDEINKQSICKKYFPPIKQEQVRGQGNKKNKSLKKISRIIEKYFNFHIDTAHLLRNSHRINPEQIISISSKVHGTSAIVSNCIVRKNLSIKEKLLKLLKFPIIETEYDYIYASRKVIKNAFIENKIHFYGTNIWAEAGEKYFKGKLKEGETVYYEICGYLPETTRCIQKDYDYGCMPGNYRVWIYRITYTTHTGDIIEYSWKMMEERCKQLSVEIVPELYYGKAKDLFPELNIEQHWTRNFIAKLIEKYLEKDCNICKNVVPFEGIVYRIEGWSIEAYKLKSERFTLRENKLMEEEVEDIEETQSEEI